MGMIVDEQIKGLEYLKKCGIFPFSDTRTGIIFTDECIDGAIETMCKYQKIQEIYERFQKDGNYWHHMAWLDVMEVLENGNDD